MYGTLLTCLGWDVFRVCLCVSVGPSLCVQLPSVSYKLNVIGSIVQECWGHFRSVRGSAGHTGREWGSQTRQKKSKWAKQPAGRYGSKQWVSPSLLAAEMSQSLSRSVSLSVTQQSSSSGWEGLWSLPLSPSLWLLISIWGEASAASGYG